MNRAEFTAERRTNGKYERVADPENWLPGVSARRPWDNRTNSPAVDVNGDPVLSDHEYRIAALGATLWQIPVVDLITVDGITRTKVGTLYVTVFDLGTAQERVEWEEHPDREFLPRPADTSFVDAVRAWYEANKGAVIKFQVLEADKAAEFVILRTFTLVDGKITEQKKFASRTDGIISVADLS